MLAVLILSRSNLFRDRIQRVKNNSSFSHWNSAESDIPQGSIKGLLLFNIYIRDLFSDIIGIDIANYEDDSYSTFAFDSKLEHIVKLLEENADKLFDWFSTTILKQTLTNITCLSNSSNQKLLGIRFNSNFRFDDHVAYLCQKASQKLNVLTRVVQYMNLAQCRSVMRAFICSQFGYW